MREYSFLEALDITSLDDYDFRFLSDLQNLTTLSIVTEGNREIDLSSQTKLEDLTIQWRKRRITGLEYCPNIKTLCLIEYQEEDFLPIVCLRSLQRLLVKTASIKSVDGIEALHSIKKLLLGNCRSLRAIRTLNGLSRLEELEINGCTKIEDYESLTDLPRLEQLKIIDCKEIYSIRFIERIPSLKFVAIVGNTDIQDGDMTPTLGVQKRAFTPRRHYNIAKDNMT